MMKRCISCVIVAASVIGIVMTWIAAFYVAPVCIGPSASWCFVEILVLAGLVTFALGFVFAAFLDNLL